MFQLVLLGGALALTFAVRNHLATPYDDAFETAAKRHSVPANLLRALATVETGGGDPKAMRADAVSPPNANGTRDYGLMQINAFNLERLGISTSQALNPYTSADAAARVLADMRRSLGDRFSSFTWAAAYNVGPDLKPELTGQAYAAKVLYHWQLFELGRVFA